MLRTQGQQLLGAKVLSHRGDVVAVQKGFPNSVHGWT